MVRLSEFIRRDMEAILANWEAFARSLPQGTSMDISALRDHAEQILEAICKDIDRAQSRIEQTAKSKAWQAPLDATETAAQTHALLRARGGFTVNEMAAEYRALRASTLGLWADACAPEPVDVEQVIRFNEAIDQALTESLRYFNNEVERSRDLLLGILGHELRNPLDAIQLTAAYLKRLNAGESVTAAADRLINSGARISSLLADLTDFSRTRLGIGIVVHPHEVDLAAVVSAEVASLRAAYPGADLAVSVRGDTRGSWDAKRLQQVLSNLVVNAIRYGAPGRPIRIGVEGEGDEVRLQVANEGARIEAPALARMFEPLARGPEQPTEQEHFGLGLYICREVVKSHGGIIKAASDETGTSVTVVLPRRGGPTS